MIIYNDDKQENKYRTQYRRETRRI